MKAEMRTAFQNGPPEADPGREGGKERPAHAFSWTGSPLTPRTARAEIRADETTQLRSPAVFLRSGFLLHPTRPRLPEQPNRLAHYRSGGEKLRSARCGGRLSER